MRFVGGGRVIRKTGDMRQRLLPIAMILVVLGWGAYLRLVNLGVNDLDDDELIHFFVARSIAMGKGPVLPSGEAHPRGIDVSRMVGFALRYVDDPEQATRLPSALLGVTNLIIFAVIAWKIAGSWAAAWATLLLAIYPEAVYQSREARFYTYQLSFGLLAFYAGWQVVRNAGRGDTPRPREVHLGWLWAVLAITCLALATRIQKTTVSVALGLGVCMAVSGSADLWVRGWRGWRESVAAQITVMGIVGTLGTILLFPDVWKRMLWLATFVPLWAKQTPGTWRDYYYGLAESFPLLVSLSPVAFLAVALRNIRLAIYLCLWFWVPFVLHSVWFAWKGDRFILLAVPALLLMAGTAAAMGCEALYRALQVNLGRITGSARWNRGVAACMIAAIGGIVIVTTPAFSAARKLPRETVSKRVDWLAAGEIIRSLPGSGDIPVGSSIPLASLLYWGRVDFSILEGSLEQGSRQQGTANGLGMVRYQERTPDFYVGVPVLPTASGIRERFQTSGSVLIGVDPTRWSYGGIKENFENILSIGARELCQARCGALRLYHWTFRGP